MLKFTVLSYGLRNTLQEPPNFLIQSDFSKHVKPVAVVPEVEPDRDSHTPEPEPVGNLIDTEPEPIQV